MSAERVGPAEEPGVAPACSVIIVTWNCWEYTDRCLEALAKQTSRDFRIVLVDNGEPGGNAETRLGAHSPTVYLRSPSNLGFAAGVNLGFAETAGSEWIAVLNPDAVPSPDWLETMLAAAAANPEYSFFGCRMKSEADPSLLDGEGDAYHVSGFAWRQGLGLPASVESGPREAFAACAAAAMFRRDALVDVGGFDSDFFCYMEDVDLGFRLRLAGHRCLIVTAAEVMHAGSVTSGRRSEFYAYHGQRNLVWTYVKNMPGPLFWIFLPLHVALNLAGLVLYALRGKLPVVLRAKYDAIAALPTVLRKRKAIQSSRRASLWSILTVLDKHLIPGHGRAAGASWN